MKIKKIINDKEKEQKKQVSPVYIEIEPNERWEVRAEQPNGLLLGDVVHTTYVFPMNLFAPKGEYWFIPKYEPDKLTIAKTKEKAFEKFLNLYCDAEVKE